MIGVSLDVTIEWENKTVIKDNTGFLSPLIGKSNGIHLTIYLNRPEHAEALRGELERAIRNAEIYLAPALKPSEIDRYLSPVKSLLNDDDFLRGFKGNIGIFRDADSIRLLSLPIRVSSTVVVATTFHVKPLLKWIQHDEEFLIVGVEIEDLVFYTGNQFNLKSISFKEAFEPYTRARRLVNHYGLPPYREKAGSTLAMQIRKLNAWLSKIDEKLRPPLYIMGRDNYNMLKNALDYPENLMALNPPRYSNRNLKRLCKSLRQRSLNRTQSKLEKVFREYRRAMLHNKAESNLFRVAHAAASGNISKLVVAENLNLFGKLNWQTGDLVLHRNHQDHEDDDVLDDLAQLVLSTGGEVVVAPLGEIPGARPVLAILKRSDNVIEFREAMGQGKQLLQPAYA